MYTGLEGVDSIDLCGASPSTGLVGVSGWSLTGSVQVKRDRTHEALCLEGPQQRNHVQPNESNSISMS